jgi:hypothetical protein
MESGDEILGSLKIRYLLSSEVSMSLLYMNLHGGLRDLFVDTLTLSVSKFGAASFAFEYVDCDIVALNT